MAGLVPAIHEDVRHKRAWRTRSSVNLSPKLRAH